MHLLNCKFIVVLLIKKNRKNKKTVLVYGSCFKSNASSFIPLAHVVRGGCLYGSEG